MSSTKLANVLSSIVYIILINQLEALRIAIVGGGPSGIFLSRLIREKRGTDADDIVIFEKADKLASLFVSHIIADGKALDFGPALIASGSFIPGDSNQFDGIYGRLQEMFDEVNAIFGIDTTLTPKSTLFYNIENNMIPPSSPVFLEIAQTNPPQEVVVEFLKQLAFLYTVQRDTTDTNGVYEIGICEKGETFIEFAARNNMANVGKYLASLTEKFAAEITGINLSGFDHSCAYMFRFASMFMVETFRKPLLLVYMITSPAQDTLIATTLQSAGFDFDTIETVQKMLNPTIGGPPNPALLHFEVGYQTIMEHIGEIERLNGVQIKLNSEVVDITKESDTLEVTVEQTRRLISDSDSDSDSHSNDDNYDDSFDDSFEFDAVFLTIRPIDAIEVLEANSVFSTAYNLYDEAKNEAGSYTSILWNTENWLSGTANEEGLFSAVGSQFNLDTSGTQNWWKILEYQCFPYGFYRDFAEEAFFIATAYTPRSFAIDNQNELVFGDIDECVTQMMQYLNDVFGLNVNEEDVVATYRKNYYPYIIGTTLESSGWYEKFEAIQGNNGLFFFGEVFSTQGVATVLRYIDVNIDDVVLQLFDIEAKLDEDYSFSSRLSGLFHMTNSDVEDNHVNVSVQLSNYLLYNLWGLCIISVAMSVIGCMFCGRNQ